MDVSKDADKDKKQEDEPDPKDEKFWSERNAELQTEIKALEDELKPLSDTILSVQRAVNTLGINTQEGQQVLGQLEIAKKSVAEVEKKLEKARGDYARFKEDARRAGVPPGWLR